MGHAGVPDKLLVGPLQLPRSQGEYKRQLQRVVRRFEDDPSVFAIELETLARRAFMEVDLNTQLQMVRDRFIDGQADRSLRRHLASLKPNTPMIEMLTVVEYGRDTASRGFGHEWARIKAQYIWLAK